MMMISTSKLIINAHKDQVFDFWNLDYKEELIKWKVLLHQCLIRLTLYWQDLMACSRRGNWRKKTWKRSLKALLETLKVSWENNTIGILWSITSSKSFLNISSSWWSYKKKTNGGIGQDMGLIQIISIIISCIT